MPLNRRLLPAAALLAGAASLQPALAFQIPFDDPDLWLRWDNTVKYNVAGRVGKVDPNLANTSPGFVDNGDRNFKRGSLITNRFDLLTEADLKYRRFGVRLSAAAWYDSVYNRTNDNPGPQVAGAKPYNEFPRSVTDLHGHKAEVLDAFVYGAGELGGDVGGSFRLGRHAFYWGESLFYGTNGIAGTMAPIDVIKAVSVPGTAFKDMLQKVPQLSGELSYGRRVTLGAYYQWRWINSRLPEAGSYFSTFDTSSTGLPAQEAHDKGQGGLQLKYSPENWNTDFGFYVTRFHAKTPSGVYVYVAPPPVRTQSYFHEGSTAIGVSSNTTFGAFNLGAEASIRRNVALASSAVVIPPGPQAVPPGNDSDTGRYAIGRTGHLQSSFIYTLPRFDLIEESGLSGEIAWNRRLSVDRNAAAVDPQTDRDAMAVQFVYTPVFRQIQPGWDLSVPVGVAYVNGKSGALGPGWGADQSGSYNLALNATYLNVHTIGLRYVGYYGPTAPRTATGLPSYAQNMRDRNNITLTLTTGF